MNMLTVKNLSYRDVFSHINMNIVKNHITLVSGPNKCGKTTLIKILCGLISSENQVFYENKDIHDLSSYDLAVLFGRVILNKNIGFKFSSIDQELSFQLDKLDIQTSEKRARYKKYTKLFDLDQELYSDIHELSRYKKIIVLIVKELLSNPKILFLDQIFDSLDDSEVRFILERLKKITNLTIVISSTKLDFSIYVSYLYILYDQKILLSGSACDVLKEDSILNKVGLELPFMNDLSIKLKYYDLLKDTELDMNRMVNKLWK